MSKANPFLRPGEHWDPYAKEWRKNLTEAQVQNLWPYAQKEALVAEFVSPDLEDTLRAVGLGHPQEDAFEPGPWSDTPSQPGTLTSPPTRRYLTLKDRASARAPTGWPAGPIDETPSPSPAELEVMGEMVNNMLDMADMVTLPQHYARFKIEPIRFICENNLNFFQGNIVKYILRHDAKNGLEDLKKARRYLDMFIKFVEGDADWWRKEA